MKAIFVGTAMALAAWTAWGEDAKTSYDVSGDYFEGCACHAGACACDFGQNATGAKGCQASLFLHVDKGHYGATALDGLNVTLVLLDPVQNFSQAIGTMRGGIYVDEKADDAQRDALTAIVKDKFGALFGEIAGPKAVAMQFQKAGTDADGLADAYDLEIPGILSLHSVPFKNEAGKRSARINVPGSFVTVQYMAKAETHTYHDVDWGVDWDLSGGNSFYSPFEFASAAQP